ncbi:MAG: hypothetical protein R2705_17250 [Ilumatobacteraceae bacterium]
MRTPFRRFDRARRVRAAALATVAGAAFSLLATLGADVADATGGSNSSDAYYDAGYVWKPVRLGGGGNISGVDAANDGTLVARSDVYGAYVLRPGADEWAQLVIPSAMPPAWRVAKMGKGVEEVVLAPSDSQRIYMMWAGHLFTSSDGGTTFDETTFASTNWDANAPFARGFGDRMAVDPTDPDTVVAGGPNTGAFVTHDGGATWQTTTIPAGTSTTELTNYSGGQIQSPGITGVAWDHTSATSAGGGTSVVYAASWGRGVYRSSDGGDTWTSIGGPAYVHHAAIDADGVYYASSGDKSGPFSVQKYVGGSWVTITPTAWRPNQIAGVENPFIGVDPLESGVLVLGYASQLFVSRDGGTTWTAATWHDGDGDVDWVDEPNGNYYLVASDLVFDPHTPGRMWLTTGVGLQYADLPTSGADLTWIERSAGTESMVATDIVSTRSGGAIFSVFDFGQFGGSRNLDDYSLKKGPVPEFAGTTAMDASPFSSNFAVSITTDYVQHGSYPISASYTLNGGKTWRRFTTMPKGATSARSFGYGTVAVSTSSNIIWAPGRYYPTTTSDFQPYYTKNRGRTWHPVRLPA